MLWSYCKENDNDSVVFFLKKIKICYEKDNDDIVVVLSSSFYVALQVQKNDDKQRCYSLSLCCGNNVCHSFALHNDEHQQHGLVGIKERQLTTMSNNIVCCHFFFSITNQGQRR